jgi:hypothetical protein
MAEEGNPPDEEMRELARRLGSRGGKKGGPARAKKLSGERKSEIASNAAKARWAKWRQEREQQQQEEESS